MTCTNFETMPMGLVVIDIADTLAIGRGKAYKLIHSGAIRSIKIGQHYRIPREAFIDSLKKGAQSA